MSNAQNTRVHPADLPADTLITFDDFSHLMPGVRRDVIELAARRGTFVPGTRFTPRAKMHFKAGDVAAYIAERLAALEVGK